MEAANSHEEQKWEVMTPRWIILLRQALLDRIKEENGGGDGP